jgi:hypothetical protein
MIDLNNGDYETYQLIKEAAALHLLTDEANIDLFYEHGQFWVTLTDNDNEDEPETTYSVVEAHGYGLKTQGIDFEEV